MWVPKHQLKYIQTLSYAPFHSISMELVCVRVRICVRSNLEDARFLFIQFQIVFLFSCRCWCWCWKRTHKILSEKKTKWKTNTFVWSLNMHLLFSVQSQRFETTKLCSGNHLWECCCHAKAALLRKRWRENKSKFNYLDENCINGVCVCVFAAAAVIAMCGSYV